MKKVPSSPDSMGSHVTLLLVSNSLWAWGAESPVGAPSPRSWRASLQITLCLLALVEAQAPLLDMDTEVCTERWSWTTRGQLEILSSPTPSPPSLQQLHPRSGWEFLELGQPVHSCTSWASLAETSSLFAEESLGFGVRGKLVIFKLSASVFPPDKGA